MDNKALGDKRQIFAAAAVCVDHIKLQKKDKCTNLFHS